MFAKSVDRTHADNFTHGSPNRITPKHGSMTISESMSDAINFAAFDAG